MADISQVKLPNNTTYTIKDGSAVANITRSGTTYTVTRRDGTTFTFTQQDANTTYTLGTSGNNITLTPSSGSVQSVTAPYATSAGSATKATQDSDGNTINTTYYKTSSLGATTFKVTRGASMSTNTGLYWAAMVNSGQAGSPTLPTTNKWWHILSMDWNNDTKNWISQLAIATQDGNGVWWRKNDASGTGIDASTWHRLAEGDADGNATNANTATKLGSSTVGSGTRPIYLNAGTATECTYTLNKSVPSDAVFTDTNDAVAVTNTNPASGTWYYPTWYTATSGTGGLNANDGFRHYSLQGTASAAGRSIISLGNNTSTGTAGNKRGELFLYSEKSGRAEIVYDAAATATVVHTFPATAGTILNTGTTSFTQSLTSGTKIGTIKINGTSTDLYCQTNTNNAVTQTATTTDANYEVLFSVTADNTTRTEGARKNSNLTFNPNSGLLTVTGTSSSNTILAKGYITTYIDTTTGNNLPAKFVLSVKDTTTGQKYNDSYIAAYNDHQSTTSGNNMVIHSGGGMFIGGGESPSNHYVAKGASYTGEDCFITADGSVYIQANGNTIANRIGFAVNSTAVLPVKADVGTNNAIDLGTSSVRWNNLYVTTIQGGTAINTQYKDTTTNTTGYVMHGRDANNKYSCIWSSSKLNFYVDTTNVGNVSDRQLKSEIAEVDPQLIDAIADCEIYQYKAFNRDGLISVGIMAQDLVEKCDKYHIRPENYELLTKMNFIQGDETEYYSVDYNQYSVFMIKHLQDKVKELSAEIDELKARI